MASIFHLKPNPQTDSLDDSLRDDLRFRAKLSQYIRQQELARLGGQPDRASEQAGFAKGRSFFHLKGHWQKRILSVAAALFLGIVTYFPIHHLATPQYLRLARQEINAAPPTLALLSLHPAKAHLAWQEAYQKGEFSTAAAFMLPTVESNNASSEQYFYFAICLLQTRFPHYDTVIQCLEKVRKNLSPDLKNQANWYLALAYIRKNAFCEAQSILEQLHSHNYKTKEVANLLQAIQSKARVKYEV
jgi:hypothetical protein